MDYDYLGDFTLPITITTADISYTYGVRTTTVTTAGALVGEASSVSTVYEYDRRGKLIEYTPPLPSGYGSITYAWNNLGQKVSMTVPMGFTGNNNARVYEYKYDMTGRQTGMEVNAATVTSNSTLASNVGSSSYTKFFYSATEDRVKLITKAGDVYYFVYDPTASVPAVVCEAVNDSGTRVTYLNARDPMGGLISRDTYEGAVRTQSRTYHFDGLGSTRSLTDENGVVTDSYTYDEWGNVTPGQNNETTDNPYQYVGKLGYYNHYQEPDFDYLQLGVRYYDPNIGRFIQRDAAEQGYCSYSYVENNPIEYIDPSGYIYCHWGWTNGLPILGSIYSYHCHWGEKPPDKPKPPEPEDPGEEAMKELAKWFTKSISGGDCGCGIDIADRLNGLPEKYQNALDICMGAARRICLQGPGIESWNDCTECYNAIEAAVGSGEAGYINVRACSTLWDGKYW